MRVVKNSRQVIKENQNFFLSGTIHYYIKAYKFNYKLIFFFTEVREPSLAHGCIFYHEKSCLLSCVYNFTVYN